MSTLFLLFSDYFLFFCMIPANRKVSLIILISGISNTYPFPFFSRGLLLLLLIPSLFGRFHQYISVVLQHPVYHI